MERDDIVRELENIAAHPPITVSGMGTASGVLCQAAQQLQQDGEELDRLKSVLEEIGSKSSCASWEVTGMGSGYSAKWIGCSIHKSDDPEEWCLCCIANQALNQSDVCGTCGGERYIIFDYLEYSEPSSLILYKRCPDFQPKEPQQPSDVINRKEDSDPFDDPKYDGCTCGHQRLYHQESVGCCLHKDKKYGDCYCKKFVKPKEDSKPDQGGE